ncbi:cell division cycle 48C [Actinidia rufa]|uniref:Cell division cycle 48C n=1 Tax=Actinidia rufa TaxID=165716 RepID=A0A7J0EZY3_9ERIC|nr:cell division cycle 48C [Actinidia rufa]
MSARKKAKRVDGSEERLQRLENQHIRRRKQKGIDDDDEEEEESEETEGAVSTSEDAIYGERIEPEFDLMKSMLRANYSDSKVAMKLKKKAGRSDGKGLGGGEEEEGKGKGKDGPRFRDLGGMEGVVEELKMEVIVPLYHPQLPRWLGVRSMAGIFLHGPLGCGKTKLAHAIANETGVPFYKISATELVSVSDVTVLLSQAMSENNSNLMILGVIQKSASEENIRELFVKAYRTAPSIVFIDEIDAIASKRENLQRETERRIVTQLMTCMDESHRLVQLGNVDPNAECSNIRPGYVLVIGATNRPDAVDPALRRPGRFDREIVLGVPSENARVEILSVLTRNLRGKGAFDLVKIARSTPGFVGADLAALANKAGNLAMERIIDRRKSMLSLEPRDENHTEDWWRNPWLPKEMENLNITMSDFEDAAKLVQPSSRREGFSTVPNVKWEDVGGLRVLRQEFGHYIVRRVKYPEDYEGFGVDLDTGFLLYGPAGCGKTLIAKAVANEVGANFIHIKGPELLSKYVGESELAVRTIFSRARTCSPCILFFDEVDALTTKRGKEGGWVVERLLNQV